MERNRFHEAEDVRTDRHRRALAGLALVVRGEHEAHVLVGRSDRRESPVSEDRGGGRDAEDHEDDFAADIQSRGINAVSSYSLTGEGQLDKDAAAAKLQEIGADAVIVTRVVDQETVQNYYPPTYSTVAAPSAYYGGWYGYYSLGYTYQTSPGYVEENKVFRVETNLYDLKGDKLMWSGLSETTLISGDAPEPEIRPLIDALVYDMEQKHVLPKKVEKKK